MTNTYTHMQYCLKEVQMSANLFLYILLNPAALLGQGLRVTSYLFSPAWQPCLNHSCNQTSWTS
jgi:hypothetical protein